LSRKRAVPNTAQNSTPRRSDKKKNLQFLARAELLALGKRILESNRILELRERIVKFRLYYGSARRPRARRTLTEIPPVILRGKESLTLFEI
jgi:hypothetical protein